MINLQTLWCLLIWTVAAVIPGVDSKYCWHIFHGHSQYFYCGVHQRCCGARCCDNIVAFYRLWYFWMCVLMLFVACSGGGFWLRRRRLGEDFRASLTNSQPGSEGFVRNLASSQHRASRPRSTFYPSPDPHGATLPVQPPPYTDVVESKPPSYDSLFRDLPQGGDNPSYQEEEPRAATGGANLQTEDKSHAQPPASMM